tara:strand:+ start:1793 stop:1975 length:183 start_codon:yes stop_codon:yes gene_type:complete
MVSFARAKTKSFLSRLWPQAEKNLKNQTIESYQSKKVFEDIAEQNKCFLEASKDGGMWFS